MSDNIKEIKNQSTVAILKRLNRVTSHNGIVPQRLAASYAIESKSGDSDEPGMGEFINALSAEQNGQLGTAIQYIEKSLLADPNDADTCSRTWTLFMSISQKVEEQGHDNPTSLEFLKNYETILRLGEVSLESHLLAAQGFFLLGDLEKAKALVSKLIKVAPNYPGLSYLRTLMEGDTKNEERRNSKKNNAA